MFFKFLASLFAFIASLFGISAGTTGVVTGTPTVTETPAAVASESAAVPAHAADAAQLEQVRTGTWMVADGSGRGIAFGQRPAAAGEVVRVNHDAPLPADVQGVTTVGGCNEVTTYVGFTGATMAPVAGAGTFSTRVACEPEAEAADAAFQKLVFSKAEVRTDGTALWLVGEGATTKFVRQ